MQLILGFFLLFGQSLLAMESNHPGDSRRVGFSMASIDNKAKKIVLEASYFHFCRKSPGDNTNPACESAIQDILPQLENLKCERILDGTFKDYHRISLRIALTNKVSVDPTTVPKPLCRKITVKKLKVQIPLSQLSGCLPGHFIISGGGDEMVYFSVDSPKDETPFQKDCAQNCSNPASENDEDCLWCWRVKRGEALFPVNDDSTPDPVQMCLQQG